MDPSIPLDSAQQLLRLQASGELTAVQIAQAALESIRQTQPTINAYTHVAAESAIAAADQIDKKRAAGQPLGPLAGLPVAVKDVLCTADMPTTCSSRMLQNYMPPYDATAVQRLRAADAVLIGKTNMDEFAMGASTENSAMGATCNPWNIAFTPGGSSGGAAATIAACNVPLSIGTDTGGSIRQPAAFTGISGLKPTYGRVSRYGLVAFASSLDQVGPMAWAVEDIALLTTVLTGYDPKDSTSLNVPQVDGAAAISNVTIKGLKVGVIRDAIDHPGLDKDVRGAVLNLERLLKDAGAEIIDLRLPHSEYGVATYYVIAPCEASSNLSRYDGAHYGYRSQSKEAKRSLVDMYCKSRDEGFGPEVKRRIMIGTYALSKGYFDAYYLKALKVRRLIRGDYDEAFKKVDVLLGPTTPSPAFRIGEKIDDPLQMYLCDLYTVGANLAGVPALAIPAGLNNEGLPLGVQFQAAPLQEDKLLRVGAFVQSQTDFHTRRPSR